MSTALCKYDIDNVYVYFKLLDNYDPKGDSQPNALAVVDSSLQLISTLDNMLHGSRLQDLESPFFYKMLIDQKASN